MQGDDMIEGLIRQLEQGWQNALFDFMESDGGKDILDGLDAILQENQDTYHPNEQFIFNAFHKTHFSDVRVVIIGQDPYPCKNCATGIAFFADGKLTPSLKNIYTAIQRNLGGTPTPNCLKRWAEDEGVLLLNSALTLRKVGKKNLHREAWKGFIQAVVEALVNSERSIHFMLWGKDAKYFEDYIVPPCYVYKTNHPTSRGANLTAFKAYRQFSMVDDVLGEDAKIKWFPPPEAR